MHSHVRKYGEYKKGKIFKNKYQLYNQLNTLYRFDFKGRLISPYNSSEWVSHPVIEADTYRKATHLKTNKQT